MNPEICMSLGSLGGILNHLNNMPMNPVNMTLVGWAGLGSAEYIDDVFDQFEEVGKCLEKLELLGCLQVAGAPPVIIPVDVEGETPRFFLPLVENVERAELEARYNYHQTQLAAVNSMITEANEIRASKEFYAHLIASDGVLAKMFFKVFAASFEPLSNKIGALLIQREEIEGASLLDLQSVSKFMVNEIFTALAPVSIHNPKFVAVASAVDKDQLEHIRHLFKTFDGMLGSMLEMLGDFRTYLQEKQVFIETSAKGKLGNTPVRYVEVKKGLVPTGDILDELPTAE